MSDYFRSLTELLFLTRNLQLKIWSCNIHILFEVIVIFEVLGIMVDRRLNIIWNG